MLKRGSEITVEVEKFADRGKSIARVDGYVVFVPGGVPGDRIRVRVTKAKRKYAEAIPIEVLEASSDRILPECPYFGTCGGCKWQHVNYQAQLEAKRLSVQEALEHHGGFEGIDVLPTIGSEQIFGYRNKMEFSFSAERWLTTEEIATDEVFDTSFALGLHAPGSFNKVLDIEECHLHPKVGNRLLNGIRSFVLENGWLPWHIRNHTGYLRHLVFRFASATNDLMVNLVTSRFDADRMEQFSAYLQSSFPEVTTFVNTINSTVAQTAFGEETKTIFGPGTIVEKIGDQQFEIASNAFFQTNTNQAKKLYEISADYADLKSDDLVYDLYSGAGTISLFVADRVRQVVGIELIEEAVENARQNAKSNGVENVTFVTGDMMRIFKDDLIDEYGRPDVLIVDPPRAGMHPKVVKQIGRLRPERFVYISCNPLTQAKDLALLNEDYSIEMVQPVDLFPHTYHVENVVKLRAR
ncbi:MAG: 23S rRNA (uracil(1939)-C(5))-methyltransferase RlmD [Bacteroidetes bacterium]|nr:23S rRNA (uracil(1939)-C(5))-methyltransferase RlmD [Bacteroidota bacterium]MCH8246685.1 23S rRNA (uracil(1939)-C(5))-methyltransferase RlmD [Bacteroidota bacterium]